MYTRTRMRIHSAYYVWKCTHRPHRPHSCIWGLKLSIAGHRHWVGYGDVSCVRHRCRVSTYVQASYVDVRRCTVCERYFKLIHTGAQETGGRGSSPLWKQEKYFSGKYHVFFSAFCYFFMHIFSGKNVFPQSWLSSYAYANPISCMLPLD